MRLSHPFLFPPSTLVRKPREPEVYRRPRNSPVALSQPTTFCKAVMTLLFTACRIGFLCAVSGRVMHLCVGRLPPPCRLRPHCPLAQTVVPVTDRTLCASVRDDFVWRVADRRCPWLPRQTSSFVTTGPGCVPVGAHARLPPSARPMTFVVHMLLVVQCFAALVARRGRAVVRGGRRAGGVGAARVSPPAHVIPAHV